MLQFPMKNYIDVSCNVKTFYDISKPKSKA